MQVILGAARDKGAALLRCGTIVYAATSLPLRCHHPVTPFLIKKQAMDKPLEPTFAFSERAQQLTSSAIREILKVTERPEVISFAGGLPAPAASRWK